MGKLIFAATAAALFSGALAQNTQTSTSDVAAAAATAKTRSPTSHVKGKAFDRIAIIWNENTDFAKADGDRELSHPLHNPQHLMEFSKPGLSC